MTDNPTFTFDSDDMSALVLCLHCGLASVEESIKSCSESGNTDAVIDQCVTRDVINSLLKRLFAVVPDDEEGQGLIKLSEEDEWTSEDDEFAEN